jgi:hypothetical protein
MNSLRFAGFIGLRGDCGKRISSSLSRHLSVALDVGEECRNVASKVACFHWPAFEQFGKLVSREVADLPRDFN